MFFLNDSSKTNVLVSCDHGLFIVNRFDNTSTSIGGFLLDHGNNNTVEADITAKSLKDVNSPIVFDIGANIGTYTSWIAKWAIPKNGFVYCFEPQRIIFQMLCGNMAINNISNVYAYEMGFASKKSEIQINEVNYNSTGSFGAFSLNNSSDKYKTKNKKQTIKLNTLDNFVKENKIKKIDFIKIDAEGMDIDILKGGLDTIEKFRPKMLIEYLNLGPSGDEKTSSEGFNILNSFLKNLGYQTEKVDVSIYAY
jgi:FkbM family methyltransferase